MKSSTLHERSPSGPPAPAGRAVTWRAAAISLIVILISAPAIFYGEVVWGTGVGIDERRTANWATGVIATWPLTVLFLATAVMSLPALRRVGLTRRELLTAYAAMLVAMPLLGAGILFHVLSTVVSYYYYARAFATWETFLPLLPTWFGPSSQSAVEGYFVGRAAVPWGEWAVSLAAWCSFLICLFGASVCLLALVQKQWISHERLAFPLAQIPLEMVEQTGEGGAGRLRRSRLFWLGLVVAGALCFLDDLSTRVPALPAMPLTIIFMPRRIAGPLAALGDLQVILSPWIIALAYLIPKDLSLSVWFFWVLKWGLMVLAIVFGAAPVEAEYWYSHEFPAPFDLVTGAVIVLSAWALWSARKHLARALRIAFTGRPRGGDADEPLPYRWAVAGLLLCFSWMVVFLVLAGCRPLVGLFYVAVVVGAFLSYARIRAELAFDAPTWRLRDITMMPTGSRALLPREVIAVFTTGWVGELWPSHLIGVCSMDALTSFKIGEAAGVPLRRLTALLFVGFLIALGAGSLYILHTLYGIGFDSTRAGFADRLPGWMFRWTGEQIYNEMVANPSGPQWEGAAWCGVGALVFVFLALMRLRFLWWPFHPVGFIIGFGLLQYPMVFSFLIAWLAKSLVLRYGGLRLYRQTLPIAIGLIMGDGLNRSLWNVISLVTHGQV
jgi:hypothetical protein